MKVEHRKCARLGCANTWTVGPLRIVRPPQPILFGQLPCGRARASSSDAGVARNGIRGRSCSVLNISRASAYLNVRRGFIPSVRVAPKSTRVPLAWTIAVLGTKE